MSAMKEVQHYPNLRDLLTLESPFTMIYLKHTKPVATLSHNFKMSWTSQPSQNVQMPLKLLLQGRTSSSSSGEGNAANKQC